MQVLVIAVQNAVEHRDLGVATSTNTFFRSLGGAFGTAVFGAILSARLLYWLPRLLPSGSDNLDPSLLLGSPEQIRSLDPAVQAAVVEAVARSVSAVFLWAVPIAVVGLIVVVFIPELPLRDTAHVGAHAAAPGAGEAPPIPAGVD